MNLYYEEKTTGKRVYFKAKKPVKNRYDLFHLFGFNFLGTDNETYVLNDVHANTLTARIILFLAVGLCYILSAEFGIIGNIVWLLIFVLSMINYLREAKKATEFNKDFF